MTQNFFRDFSGRSSLCLSISSSCVRQKKIIFLPPPGLFRGFHRSRYGATSDCILGLVARAGKVTKSDQVAPYPDMVVWLWEKGRHWEELILAPEEISWLIGKSLPVWAWTRIFWVVRKPDFSLSTLWPRSELLIGSQFVEIPVMFCKQMRECVCTQLFVKDSNNMQKNQTLAT